MGKFSLKAVSRLKDRLKRKGAKRADLSYWRACLWRAQVMLLGQLASLEDSFFFSCKRFWLHNLYIHSKAKFCDYKCIWNVFSPLGPVFGFRIPGSKRQDEAMLFCKVWGLTSRSTTLHFQRWHGWQARKHDLGLRRKCFIASAELRWWWWITSGQNSHWESLSREGRMLTLINNTPPQQTPNKQHTMK